MDLPADELHPAKHQTGVVAGEAEAGKDEDVQNEDGDLEDKELADDQGIPELTESDDGDEKMNPVDRNFVEPDDEDGDEPAAPRRPEDGPVLGLPDAKRSRRSRISALQNLCKITNLRTQGCEGTDKAA